MKKQSIIWLVIAILVIIGGVTAFTKMTTDKHGGNGDKPGDSTPKMQEVWLFYYKKQQDIDPKTGSVLCSADAVLPVMRTIPTTATPLKDTLTLHLKGELTADEKAAGFSTEFPLRGLSLASLNLKSDGTLEISLNDSESKTNGGACRVGLLAAQIVKTAQQFATVQQVRFVPEDAFFQP
jgi:hypothetical protein